MTSFEVVVTGQLEGLVACSAEVQHGPLKVWEDDEERVLFELKLRAATENQASTYISLAGAAIGAMVAIGWGVWVGAIVEGATILRPDGTQRVSTSRNLRFQVRADLASEATAPASEEALHAILAGQDDRVKSLLSLFGVGLRASESVEPVAGLWAFSTVVEEEAPRKKRNIDHASTLADELRKEGMRVPVNPRRAPAEIRASAMHPTPHSPLPTFDEVQWFGAVARAYLAKRVAGRLAREIHPNHG